MKSNRRSSSSTRTPWFKETLTRFRANQLRDWNIAIKFFANNKARIRGRRNAYGAHVQANLAKYILSRVEDADESVGSFEVAIHYDHSYHYVFKFAESLVNTGLFFDCGEQEREPFMKESMEMVTDAIRHAALAVQALADHYILPTFGW